MTFSYTADPINNTVDAVRLKIGDTDLDDPQLQDEEISYYLSEASSNVTKAASLASRGLAAKYARLADEVVGEVEVKWSQRSKRYLDLAEQLENELSSLTKSTPLPFAGGISKSDIANRRSDSDRVDEQFNHQNFDNDEATFV